MAQNDDFTCIIEDFADDGGPQRPRRRFSAKVTVAKRFPIRRALQREKIELANVYIQPVSAQLSRHETSHDHFVVYDATGRGLYIRRDQYSGMLDTRECSIWDLGQAFATRVMTALKDFA